MMENVQESENNAAISKSTFSNKNCNNIQAIRSYSSKSMHSGSNSSGSSGYGGKKFTSGYGYKPGGILNKKQDTENNAKVSDSAYSNSCSNSQSRRSYSSKSMHSGSNSSASSGYGGKPSTSGYSSHAIQMPEKRIKDKEAKKKKKIQIVSKVKKDKYVIIQSVPELEPVFETPKENTNNVVLTPPPALELEKKTPEMIMDISSTLKCSIKKECGPSNTPVVTALNCVTRTSRTEHCMDGFSCVISMQDGIVMYTTTSITTALGFPKDMWLGRSFIDFVHPRDRNTFASQITSGLTIPKNVNVPAQGNQTSTMVCRIRKYRGLTSGFRIKEKIVSYMPFLLKFFFKNIRDEEGHVIYLVIQATPFFSAFKSANEIIVNAKPFVIRHSATGSLDYIDTESVPYLGYLPQDIVQKDALQLYHPSDLGYLRQVYEAIVKEGVVERSKPYRMLTQNGDYLKLETEWSSFINPWSRKLEFVTGKHFIIEGPRNPDVFQTVETERIDKIPDEEQKKAQLLRQNITRVMNEVLTKPAEAAKQQMGKRCQDLASFMESLLEETPNNNNDTELKLEIQDPDNSFYERDSVMLGGMSPHHDYNDSKSSTETPISYNQLNYNETLQRYFDSHQPYEEYPLDDNKLELREAENSKCALPAEREIDEFGEKGNLFGANSLLMTQYSHPLGDYQAVRLTESLLSKHNSEMEKELVKMHRDNRIYSKIEKEKISNEMKQKKKEHLARCNAYIQQSILENSEQKAQGVKRSSKQLEEGTAHKHRCSSARLIRQKQIARAANTPSTPTPTMGVIPMFYTPAPIHHATMTSQEYHLSRTSPHMPGHPITDRMTPHTSMSGAHYQGHRNEAEVLFKMNTKCSTSTSPSPSTHVTAPYQPHQMPYLMFGQAVYAPPFMYSSIDPQISYTLQQSFVPQIPNIHSLGISTQNYEEACRLTLLPKTAKSFNYLTRKREKIIEKNIFQACDVSIYSAEASIRSTEAIIENRNKRKLRLGNSDGTNEKTDEESSYSSFYSSFFKTDSGSNEESDGKNTNTGEGKCWRKPNQSGDAMSFQSYEMVNSETKDKIAHRRNIEPPWMKQNPKPVGNMDRLLVRVTSELIYKYQILTKDVDEVLSCDKKKLEKLEQPSLVNEQLDQLYLDLQLQGVAAKLTLEEGITSSSSSGEESYVTTKTKIRRRKREYSKLVMIYEEDAPLPPPDEEDVPFSA
ncbi:period circadian protein isoform X5 [Vanessa atalanta]|uniref:period circadian protein isoform X5 n=1 Tax=Vanessa atalanta TaxID=42275 RepID=UPI001FCD3EA9|nr:period circadian protein isoform X5 [Vanessa atalanta]